MGSQLTLTDFGQAGYAWLTTAMLPRLPKSTMTLTLLMPAELLTVQTMLFGIAQLTLVLAAPASVALPASMPPISAALTTMTSAAMRRTCFISSMLLVLFLLNGWWLVTVGLCSRCPVSLRSTAFRGWTGESGGSYTVRARISEISEIAQ